MKIVFLGAEDKCEFSGCNKLATTIAAGRKEFQKIGVYCHEHADTIVSDDFPEYSVRCPNCECEFGVN